MTQLSPPRIVCAANRSADGRIILGARHWDNLMRSQYDPIMDSPSSAWEQGFIDQHGVFYNRKNAWVIACERRQIRKYVGNQSYKDDNVYGAELYSENLY